MEQPAQSQYGLSEIPLQKTTKITTDRHAFILGNDLVFTANIPNDWRYLFFSGYDYMDMGKIQQQQTGKVFQAAVKLVGAGMDDGEDNFFNITVYTGKKEFMEYYSDDFSTLMETPFVFCDGTQGTWKYRTWEGEPGHGNILSTYYEGIVQDAEGKCSIYLIMLKEEFDANAQEIMNFLESVCIGELSFGIDKSKKIFDQEFMTLHIWDEYLHMAFQIPEGAALWKKDQVYEGYGVRSYRIYLDQDKHIYFQITADPGGILVEPTGEISFFLNTEDFTETVYELEGGTSEDYYFPQWHLLVQTNVGKMNQELIKTIMRSFQFK